MHVRVAPNPWDFSAGCPRARAPHDAVPSPTFQASIFDRTLPECVPDGGRLLPVGSGTDHPAVPQLVSRPPRSRAAYVFAVAAAAAAGWSCVCAATLARAQPREQVLELSWLAPAECPTRPEVLERIRAHLPALESSSQHLQAFASVTRSGTAYALVLALRGQDLVAQKQLEVESCPAAADAAALLIALAIDPNAVIARDPSGAPVDDGASGASNAQPVDAAPTATADAEAAAKPVPVAQPTPVAASRVPATRDAPPAASAAEPLRFGFMLGAELASDVGMLPQAPAWGLHPWLSVAFGRLRVAGGFSLWLPGQTRVDRLDATVKGRAIGGDLALGIELLQSRWVLAPGAVAELLELTLSTTGVSDPGAADTAWVALGPGLHASYRLIGGLRVVADTSVIFPLTRARFLVHTDGADFELLETSVAAFRASLGLAYQVR